jgi:lantibiotic transport system permease protein
VLQTLVLLRWEGEYGGPKIDAWMASMTNVLNLWAILALPLFITLETALLAQTEHSEKQWKHLFALAVPRWVYYAAKWITGAVLVLFGHVFLLGGTLLSGYFIRWVRPDLGFDAAPPVAWMARILGLVWLIALLVLSIHTWVSLHFHSFTVAVGVGMAAAVANIILISSQDGQHYFPWTLPINALPAAGGANLPYALLVGILGGVLLALLGGWEVTRRDVL